MMTTVLPQFCKSYEMKQLLMDIEQPELFSRHLSTLTLARISLYHRNINRSRALDEHVCVEERLVSRAAPCARHCAQRGLNNSLSGLAAQKHQWKKTT